MFIECCCSLALVFLSYLLLYNLRFGCKVEVQYVVRYERYGEVEDEKAGGKEAPKTVRSALNSLYFKLLYSR